MSELNSIIASNNRRFREKMKNVPLEILVESVDGDQYTGYDQFFNKILIQSNEDITGDWITLESYEVYDEYNLAKF
jgi:tRNA A37 methylthiotransferase MiaB